MPLPSSPLSAHTVDQHLDEAFRAARRRAKATVLPAIPRESIARTPEELAVLACDGYDVRSRVREHVGDEFSAGQQHWAATFVEVLSAEWVNRLQHVPDDDLADRWVSATEPLTTATTALGMSRLHARIVDPERLRQEQQLLRDALADAPVPGSKPRPRL